VVQEGPRVGGRPKNLRAREEDTSPSIGERVNYLAGSHRNSLASPTRTRRDAHAIANAEFRGVLGRLRALIETDMRRLKEALREAGAL
jgi:hypothetical protein